MLDDYATDLVRRATDNGIQIGAEVLDNCHGRIGQSYLDVAELCDTAPRSIRVAETHHDALDAVTVACQHESQPAPGVVSQGGFNRKSQTLSDDVHGRFFLHAQ